MFYAHKMKNSRSLTYIYIIISYATLQQKCNLMFYSHKMKNSRSLTYIYISYATLHTTIPIA